MTHSNVQLPHIIIFTEIREGLLNTKACCAFRRIWYLRKQPNQISRRSWDAHSSWVRWPVFYACISVHLLCIYAFMFIFYFLDLCIWVQNGDEQLRAAHSSWVRWPAVSHCSSSGGMFDACLCVPPVSCVFVCLCICRCILVCVCVYIFVRILSGFADRQSLTAAAAAACSTPQTISRDHQPLWHSFACFVKVALRIKCKLTTRPRWEVARRNMCVRISRRTFLVCSQQSSVTADRNMLQARGSRCKPDAQTVSTANSLDTANSL